MPHHRHDRKRLQSNRENLLTQRQQIAKRNQSEEWKHHKETQELLRQLRGKNQQYVEDYINSMYTGTNIQQQQIRSVMRVLKVDSITKLALVLLLIQSEFITSARTQEINPSHDRNHNSVGSHGSDIGQSRAISASQAATIQSSAQPKISSGNSHPDKIQKPTYTPSIYGQEYNVAKILLGANPKYLELSQNVGEMKKMGKNINTEHGEKFTAIMIMDNDSINLAKETPFVNNGKKMGYSYYTYITKIAGCKVVNIYDMASEIPGEPGQILKRLLHMADTLTLPDGKTKALSPAHKADIAKAIFLFKDVNNHDIRMIMEMDHIQKVPDDYKLPTFFEIPARYNNPIGCGMHASRDRNTCFLSSSIGDDFYTNFKENNLSMGCEYAIVSRNPMPISSFTDRWKVALDTIPEDVKNNGKILMEDPNELAGFRALLSRIFVDGGIQKVFLDSANQAIVSTGRNNIQGIVAPADMLAIKGRANLYQCWKLASETVCPTVNIPNCGSMDDVNNLHKHGLTPGKSIPQDKAYTTPERKPDYYPQCNSTQPPRGGGRGRP